MKLYIYPDNLNGKATMFLWALKDIPLIGTGLIISVFFLAQVGFSLPLIITATYAFLSIRFEETCILDYLNYASAFLLRKPQTFYWKPSIAQNLEE